MGKQPHKSTDNESRPDAWQRFERAVDAAIKSGPKHRMMKTAIKRKAKKSPKK
jgi:hypothetical protein